MYTYLINFIGNPTILYKYQFGFRTSHVTNNAIISLVGKINNELDSGNGLIGVYSTFKKVLVL